MTPSARHIALIAGLGSLALLLGAWGFQHIGGLAPCPMCIWQRWPHGVSAALGVAAVLSAPFWLWALAGLLSTLIGTGLAVFHTGVERAWWEGPSTCTSGNIDTLTPQQLMDQIMSAPMVRCDEIAWTLFGLSMANWNALISLGLCGLWLMALMQREG